MNDSKKEINNNNNINNINTNNASNNNNNTNQLNKKVYIHRKKNYLLEDKKNFTIKEIYTKTEKDIKSSKCIKLLIKNICTKDKRIFIRVTYIPYVYKSKKNLKYLNTVYSIDNNIKYNYIASNKRIKNLLKRKNDLEKKLSLIKEEDEKSRCLNSTKSSKMFEEEINSTNKNHKYVKITKEITHFNLQVTKMVKRLERYFNNSNIDLKKDFIYKLKIISLVSYIRKIIINKIKDTYIAKCLRRNKRYVIDENKIIQDKIKRKKMKENIQQISNIYIKDKIFLNNIIINDHFLSSRSFDYNKEFNKFESPQLKHNKYRKYNDYDIDDDKPKTERFNCNYIEENH